MFDMVGSCTNYDVISVVFIVTIVVGLHLFLQIRIGTRPCDVKGWNSNHCRPLGLTERWYSASHITTVMNNFCVVIHCENTNPKSLSRDSWIQAIRHVIDHQLPFLRATIIDDDINPRFEEISDINVGDQLSFHTRHDNTTWAGVIEKENTIGFGYETKPSPLWRVVLVTSKTKIGEFDLIITVHHAMCDGRAAMQFAKALLAQIAKFQTTPAVDLAQIPQLPLDFDHAFPAMDSAIDLRPSIGFVLKLIFQTNFCKNRGGGWRGNEIVIDGVEENRSSLGVILHDHLSSTVSTDLFKKCKEHHVTVTECLTAANCIACAHAAKNSSSNLSSVPISFQLPVDLRSRFKPPVSIDLLGTCISGVDGDLIISTKCDEPIDKKSRYKNTERDENEFKDVTWLWELSRTVSVWKDPVVVLESLNTIGVLEFAGELRPRLHQLRQKSPAGRCQSLSVSNLGRIDFGRDGRYGSILVRMARQAQLKPGEGPVFNFMTTTSLPHGVLAWSAACLIENVTATQADVYQQKLTQILHAAAGHTAPTHVHNDYLFDKQKSKSALK